MGYRWDGGIIISKAKIKFLSTFHEVTGAESVELDFSDNADLDHILHLLEEKFGRKFSEHVRQHLDYVVIYINNLSFRQLDGLKTVINDGDRIIIGHVLAGG